MDQGLSFYKDKTNGSAAYRPDAIHSRATFVATLIVVLLSFVIISNVQAASRDNSRFLNRLSPNEGLSQSEVTQTIQDNQGFIWIATKMGLNRYDGYKVKQIEGPNGIFTKEEISQLFLDMQGYLWISTMNSGLYRLNPVTYSIEPVSYTHLTLPTRS